MQASQAGYGRFSVLVAAVLFSTGGAAIKACSLTSLQVAAFRSLAAALFLIAATQTFPRRATRATLAFALAYAATMMLFVTANKMTTAANTIFLQSTAPLYLLLLGPWLLGERVRAREVAHMAVVGLAMLLFFVGTDATFATAPRPQLGNALAAASGLTWALTVLGLRYTARAAAGELPTAISAVIAGNLLTFLVLLPVALPVEGGAGDWLLIGYLGIFQVGAAYYFLGAGVRSVSAFEASLLLLLEPALNPIWAWLVHGEAPGALPLLGGLLILGATALRAIAERTARD